MRLTLSRICAPLLLALAFFNTVGAAYAAPATPSQISPWNGTNVGGTAIAFSWSSSAGATNYYFQLARDSGFTNIAYGGWIGNYVGITMSGLPDNGQVFYWRVAAWNSTGSSSLSPIWSVTNGPSAPPPTPTQISPLNGAKVSGTSIAFKWSQVARATNYYLQVATDPGFTKITYASWVGNYIGITLTSLPDNGQVFYWRVAAWNSKGSSFLSPIWSVTNGPSALPAVPVQTSPVNGATVSGTSIAFSWSQAARANNYNLQVATDPGFTKITYASWVGNYIGITLTGLPDNGQIYYWRVASANALGVSAYSSPARTVTNGPSALPAVPAQIAPYNGAIVSGTSIAFSWTQAARANNYNLQVATDTGFTKVVYVGWVGNYTGITLNGLPDNGQVLYWRVASANALGVSAYSAPWNVVNGPSALPANTGQIAPANGVKVSGTSIVFSWTQAARANNYYLQIAKDSSFTQIAFGSWLGNYIGITISGLPDNGQIYYWRVASGNALGVSTYSIPWSLVNGPSAIPEIPIQLAPANAATVARGDIVFQWSPAARASQYYLQVATDINFTSSSLVYGAWGTETSVTVPGFSTLNVEYYWRVASWNTLGASVYSSPSWRFKTGPDCVALTGSGSGSLVAQDHIDTCFQDAANAYLLQDISRRANSATTGTLHSHGGAMAAEASINTGLYNGGMLLDADNIWSGGGANQASAVDAHVYAGWMYDYLQTFKLNSYNGAGISMRSNVGLTCNDSYGPYNNASWYQGVVSYCVGAGTAPLSAALDIVGHEWAHAVTQMAGANLKYEYESGALNEAFSDWMGTAVEHSRGEFNWTVGEGAETFRDMANPRLYPKPSIRDLNPTPYPDTYGGAGWFNLQGCVAQGNSNLPGYNDACGVHRNSSVANKMFYLLSVGGTHNGVMVRGIGIAKAIQVAYRANTGGAINGYWAQNSTFFDGRIGMIKAAGSFPGFTFFEVDQVRNAWAAVKVNAIHNISAVASPAAGGTVSGAGSYLPGTTVSLTATANPGYVFVNWTEYGVQVGILPTYSFTANSSRSLVANFRLQ